MDFTREPIIESVITPKEGCKLVVRSSKGAGQEEFFVDAVEVVSFGNTFFLRSLEKPKSFLVPATDYEILEVRETRMVLKNVGLDRSIKIGGGREGGKRTAKEASKPEIPEPRPEQKPEPKRRERRRHYRKRRGKDSAAAKEQAETETEEVEKTKQRVHLPTPEEVTTLEEEGIGKPIKPSSQILSSLLPPPPTLISESIERYKGNELFKDVFIPKDEFMEGEAQEEPSVAIEAPEEQEEAEGDETAEEDALDLSIDLEAPEPDVPIPMPGESFSGISKKVVEEETTTNDVEKSVEEFSDPVLEPETEPEQEAEVTADVEIEVEAAPEAEVGTEAEVETEEK